MKKYISISAINMSKFLFLSMLLLAAMGIQAQSNTGVVTDTTEVYVGKKVITITVDSVSGKKDVQVHNNGDEDDKDDDEIKPVDTEFLGLDLGINWLMYNNSFSIPTNESSFETEPLRSSQVSLHMLPTHFNMAKGKVSILTALTFENHRYQFRNNISMVPGQSMVTTFTDSVTFKKNKLNMWYAQIPLLLSLRTKPTDQGHSFHFSLGGFAGLFLGASTKQKSEERGKVIFKDDYNLNPLRYGVTARIGYGNLELYTNYTLSTMFRDGQGPTFNNINFGIALTGTM